MTYQTKSHIKIKHITCTTSHITSKLVPKRIRFQKPKQKKVRLAVILQGNMIMILTSEYLFYSFVCRYSDYSTTKFPFISLTSFYLILPPSINAPPYIKTYIERRRSSMEVEEGRESGMIWMMVPWITNVII